MQDFKKEFGENIYKTGIYKISTTYDSSLFYIGMASRKGKHNCSSGFYSRWVRHLYDLDRNKHSNPFLQRVYNKYTKDCLKFEILEFCDFEDCVEKEHKLIESLKPPFNLYKNKYCRTNYKVSYETRLKIIKANTGRKHTPETIEKMKRTNGKNQCRYINGIKVPIEEVISIDLKLLEKFKILITNEKYSLSNLSSIYKFSKAKIERNLKVYFKDESLMEILYSNKIIRLPSTKPHKKRKNLSENADVINKILGLYREGYIISKIRNFVNLNEDLIVTIIKLNMNSNERKQIRSKNFKRK